MAYECPDCLEDTLSDRSITVKKCVKCGKVVGGQDLANRLKKLGVTEDTIKKVMRDLTVDAL